MKDITISLDDYPYAYYHLEEGGCEKVAFLLTHKPVIGGRMFADYVIMPDGRKPLDAEKTYCGHCGALCADFMIAYVKKREKGESK